FPSKKKKKKDVLPVQASSVPCECLFSGSKQTATDRRARLGSDRFEELELMKFSWKKNLIDIATWNQYFTLPPPFPWTPGGFQVTSMDSR
ncbi:hypothetical protein JOM56_002290, partial [Amanita muscaria]